MVHFQAGYLLVAHSFSSPDYLTLSKFFTDSGHADSEKKCYMFLVKYSNVLFISGMLCQVTESQFYTHDAGQSFYTN